MLYPGLPNLFKMIIVVRSAALSVEVKQDYRMVRFRERKKIHAHVSGVARGCADAQADLAPGAAKLVHACYVSRDDVRPRVKTVRNALR